jgi:hypothetical protein
VKDVDRFLYLVEHAEGSDGKRRLACQKGRGPKLANIPESKSHRARGMTHCVTHCKKPDYHWSTVGYRYSVVYYKKKYAI